MAIASINLPPGPKPRLLWGNLWAFRRDPIGFLNEARDYGDIVYIKLGPQDVFMLNNPDYIKEVLVIQSKNFKKSRGLERAKRLLGEGLLTSEGDYHRRQRRLAQPAFHRQRIATYGSAMTDYGIRIQERWQDGETRDISREMMRLTLAIVGKTLFDADVEGEAEEIGEAITLFIHGFGMLLLPFSELLEKLPLPGMRRLHKARDLLDGIVYKMIEERRASGRDHGDLLSMLLIAQDEEGDGGGMTDEQVRDEALTILLAGHETTANALTWTWYLISQNPDVEERLWAEIDALGERVPTMDDLPRLRYTEMVFAESMRLYPPAWIIGRRALKDCEIGGYIIPKDAFAFMSQFIMHRDPRYFPDPLRFDPLRWTHEAQALRPKFSYFPFGGGPRQCIGESFAWMEGVLLIATIARRWQLRLEPDQAVELYPLITLRPKNGMRMRLIKRKN